MGVVHISLSRELKISSKTSLVVEILSPTFSMITMILALASVEALVVA